MKDLQIKDLDNKISFESLLGEISSNLLSIPIESVDAAIESSMKILVEFFDADRCHLGEFSIDQSKIEVSYFYSRASINIPPINVIGEGFLPFVFNSIKQDEIINFFSPSDLPVHAKQERAEFERLGIKSLLVIPLQIGNEVKFGLSLSSITKHIKWEKQTINRIMIAANILANAIQRKMALKQILDEKEWTEAVMEGMPQLNYVFDIQGRMKRWNKKLQDLFGYTEEELKDKFMGDFFETEEDMKRVWTEVEKVIQDGRERSVEYNFITKSGKVLPYYYGSGSIMEIGSEKYIVGQTINISKIKQAQEKITSQLEEIKELKNQLEAENIYLRHELNNTKFFW